VSVRVVGRKARRGCRPPSDANPPVQAPHHWLTPKGRKLAPSACCPVVVSPPRNKNEDAELAKADSAFLRLVCTSDAPSRRDHHAALPGACVGVREPADEVIADASLLGVRQPHNEHAGVLAGRELARVREVQIVRDEEAVLGLCRSPYVLFAATTGAVVCCVDRRFADGSVRPALASGLDGAQCSLSSSKSITPPVLEGAMEISDGALLTSTAMYSNLIPLPLRTSGSVRLKLTFCDGKNVSGGDCAIDVNGVARFLEVLPADMYPGENGQMCLCKLLQLPSMSRRLSRRSGARM
jgi:hypothetical protein